MNRLYLVRRYLFGLVCLLSLVSACSANQSEFRVAIDVGHSQSSWGALSSRGIHEYRFNSRLARELLAAIRGAGYINSYLINEDGDLEGKAGLHRRTEIANDKGANLFISIHHDSVQPMLLQDWSYQQKQLRYNDEIQGFSIIFSSSGRQQANSLHFARLLGDALLRNDFNPTDYHAMDIPGERRKLVDRDRGIYDIDFWVVKQTEMPSVLFEAGMIVNRNEETNLDDPVFRARIIDSFVDSIRAFEQRQSP